MQGRRIGRYVLGPELAAGGMASVHLARMLGSGRFGKTVAMKRLHPRYARDPEFVTLFHDEARVSSALTHPNIVMTLDVLDDEQDGELFLVMEYVHGASLSQIQGRPGDRSPLPIRITAGIIADMLDGLHAAHEATDENGEPLDIVHRDVSPQNLLVTFQGVAKLADFGIAKAAGQVHSTGEGSVKGKIAYLAPEQLLRSGLTPRTDVYAAGMVLWEALTGRRLIDFSSKDENLKAVLTLAVRPPSEVTAGVSPALDAVVLRALERDPAKRFATAKQMGAALRSATEVAHAAEIGDWLLAERPRLREMRDLSLAHLQHAVGTTLGTLSSQLSPSQARLLAAAEEVTAIEVPDSRPRPSVPEAAPKSAPELTPASLSGASAWTTAGLPARRPRWLFPVLATIAVAAAVGGASLVVTRETATAAPVSAPTASAAPAPKAPAAGSGSGAASVEIADVSPPATSASTSSASASSASASSASASSAPVISAAGSAEPASARPRPVVSTSSAVRRCKIVPTTDGVGHTKFTEVCP